MKTRFAAALFALALPLCAQAPVSPAPVGAEVEALFYKAYYLEKGPRDLAQAMTLYEQFLAKAPEHKLASEAARYQFGLLDRVGKTKERDAFKEKYAKLLGDVAVPVAGGRGERPAGEAADGERPARPGQAGGAGARGQRGAGGMGLMGGKPLAEMNDEELEQFKGGIDRMVPMLDRMRQNMTEEQQKKLDENLAALKKNLEAGKLEDAQKALDGVREVFPRGRGRGGEGGDAGGAGSTGGAGQGGRRGGGGGEGGGRAGGGGGGGGR